LKWSSRPDDVLLEHAILPAAPPSLSSLCSTFYSFIHATEWEGYGMNRGREWKKRKSDTLMPNVAKSRPNLQAQLLPIFVYCNTFKRNAGILWCIWFVTPTFKCLSG
jgi:hypothetical protein